MAAMIKSTIPRSHLSANWRNDNPPAALPTPPQKKLAERVEVGDVKNIRPRHILWLPEFSKISEERGSSISLESLPSSSIEYRYPVIVHSCCGDGPEVFVCASSSGGRTAENRRPAWYAEAMVMPKPTNQEDMQQKSAARCLNIAKGYMRETTCVRTNLVFEIDRQSPMYYIFVTDPRLDEPSVGLLEAKYLGSRDGSLYKHKRTGSVDSGINVSFDRMTLEAPPALRDGRFGRFAIPFENKRWQRSTSP